MKVQVLVVTPDGMISEGIGKKSNLPYRMARQKVAVTIPGNDYPVVTDADVEVPKHATGFGEPLWIKPGRYEADAQFEAGEFGQGIECKVDYKRMRSLAETTRKAA